jgi:hypothetical protein
LHFHFFPVLKTWKKWVSDFLGMTLDLETDCKPFGLNSKSFGQNPKTGLRHVEYIFLEDFKPVRFLM